MRVETIQVPIYEVGDIITVSNDVFRLTQKKHTVNKAEKAMIFERKQLTNKSFSYRILCDNGKVLTLKPEELGKETYIDSVDLSPLFGKEV